MSDKYSFETYFANEIEPLIKESKLADYKPDFKKGCGKIIGYGALWLISIVFVVIISNRYIAPVNEQLSIGVIITAIVGSILFFFIKVLIRNKKVFGNAVTPKIVEHITNAFTYNKKGIIDIEEFKNADFFVVDEDIYSGNDFFQGIIGNMQVEFCNLRAALGDGLEQLVDLNITDLGKLQNISDSVTAMHSDGFIGIFMVAYSPNKFPLSFKILPKKADPPTGEYSYIDMRERGNLQNVSVYSKEKNISSPLPADIARTIDEYTEKTKNEIYLSIKGSKIYMAAPLPSLEFIYGGSYGLQTFFTKDNATGYYLALKTMLDVVGKASM